MSSSAVEVAYDAEAAEDGVGCAGFGLEDDDGAHGGVLGHVADAEEAVGIQELLPVGFIREDAVGGAPPPMIPARRALPALLAGFHFLIV